MVSSITFAVFLSAFFLTLPYLAAISDIAGAAGKNVPVRWYLPLFMGFASVPLGVALGFGFWGILSFLPNGTLSEPSISLGFTLLAFILPPLLLALLTRRIHASMVRTVVAEANRDRSSPLP